MGKFWQEIKHAFAVEPQTGLKADELPPHLERLARAVVERGMTTPVLIFLESARPLNFFAGQSMVAAWPLVKLFTKTDDFKEVAYSLENREMMHMLAERILQLAEQNRECT